MKTIVCFLLLFMITGCGSCLSKFYGVHEKTTPLKINIDGAYSLTSMRNYIDSANNKTTTSFCTPPQIIPEARDKVLCLNEAPCECYLLSLNEGEICIQGIYSPHINEGTWLIRKEQIDDSTISRIKSRFKDEVLKRLK